MKSFFCTISVSTPCESWSSAKKACIHCRHRHHYHFIKQCFNDCNLSKCGTIQCFNQCPISSCCRTSPFGNSYFGTASAWSSVQGLACLPWTSSPPRTSSPGTPSPRTPTSWVSHFSCDIQCPLGPVPRLAQCPGAV